MDTGLTDNDNEVGLLKLRPLGFVHVPKTGSTSASDWIEAHVPPDQQFVCDHADHFASVGRASMLEKGMPLDFTLVRGHFRLKDGYKYTASLRNTPRFFFTILREPEAQTMSLLWHFVSQRRNLTVGRDHAQVQVEGFIEEYIEIAESLEFNGDGSQSGYFLRYPDKPFRNGRKLENIDHDVKFFKHECFKRIGLVGLNERLLDSLRLLAWSLKWRAPRNIGLARLSGAGGVRLPEEIRAILWRRLAYDQALYEVAKRNFNRAFDRLLAAAGSEDQIDDFLDSRAEHGLPVTSGQPEQAEQSGHPEHPEQLPSELSESSEPTAQLEQSEELEQSVRS